MTNRKKIPSDNDINGWENLPPKKSNVPSHDHYATSISWQENALGLLPHQLPVEGMIPLSYITVDESKQRSVSKEDQDLLTQSVRDSGLLTRLIVNMDHGYHLVAGFTRLKALQTLGLNPAPVRIFKGLTPEQCEYIRLAENAHRADLSAEEKAEWAAQATKLLFAKKNANRSKKSKQDAASRAKKQERSDSHTVSFDTVCESNPSQEAEPLQPWKPAICEATGWSMATASRRRKDIFEKAGITGVNSGKYPAAQVVELVRAAMIIKAEPKPPRKKNKTISTDGTDSLNPGNATIGMNHTNSLNHTNSTDEDQQAMTETETETEKDKLARVETEKQFTTKGNMARKMLMEMVGLTSNARVCEFLDETKAELS